MVIYVSIVLLKLNSQSESDMTIQTSAMFLEKWSLWNLELLTLDRDEAFEDFF
jgi:hypothetical protein